MIAISPLADKGEGKNNNLEVVTSGPDKDAEGWVTREELAEKRALQDCRTPVSR